MDLRRGISAAVDKVVEVLKSRAQMISTPEEIAQVLSDKHSMIIRFTFRWPQSPRTVNAKSEN